MSLHKSKEFTETFDGEHAYVVCACGHTNWFHCMRLEHGQDVTIESRHCNGISHSYYDCSGGDSCYDDHPRVEVTKTFVRWTCPQCERVAESSIEEVEKA